MKKKWTIVAFSICIAIVAGLIATIIVLASGTQGVGTSVSVLYVATDIEGTVSAKYSKVNKNTSAIISTTDMVTSSGSKTVSFLSTAPTTTSLLNPTESNIALTAEQDLIITYTFTAVETYYATLEYKDNSTSASNIEFSYALNDGAYSDNMSMPIEVTPDKSTTYSIKLHIANTARNANLSGSLNWALTKEEPDLPLRDSNISIYFVNNDKSAITQNNVAIQKNVDGTKFKIVGPTPIIDSTSTTSYLNGNFDERTITATGKVSSIDDLTNSNGAEFYYFCTNSAVVGSLSYNDPGEVYYTSTADSTLESWYDLPSSNTNLYACFMTPNYTTEEVYTGTDSQIIISNKVTKIIATAFNDKKTITDVVFPQSVQIIEDGYDSGTSTKGAFLNNVIEKINFPNSISKIGDYAFYGMRVLQSITLSSSLIEIGNYTFSYCGISSINLPNGLRFIGGSAFKSCAISELVIPEGVISIGGGAFTDCNLTSVEVPNSILKIGNNAFGTNVYNVFNNVNYLGNASNLYMVACGLVSKEVTTFTLSNETKLIASGAFSDCSQLVNVVIPDSVIGIGSSAFSACVNLESVILGSELTSIDVYTFIDCQKLTEIIIPNAVTSIGESAFSNCVALTSISIPDNVNNIGAKAFFYCTALTNIEIGAGVKEIGEQAFARCEKLVNITIPKNVVKLGNNLFGSCVELVSVVFEDSLSTWTAVLDNPLLYPTPIVKATNILVSDSTQNVTYLRKTYNACTWTKNS